MGSHIVDIELHALSTDGHPSDSQTPRTPASDDNSSSIPTTVPPLHQAPTAPCSPPAPLSPSDRWIRNTHIENVFMTSGNAGTGLYSYCKRLEAGLESPDSVLRACWLDAWPGVAPTPATFWQWVEALNGGIKDIRAGGNADPTYRDIVRHLYPAASHTTEIGAVSYLIFATICCVTAVGRPTINPPPSNNRATALGMQIHGAQFRVPVETSIDSLVSNSFVNSRRLTQADPSRTPGNNAVHPDNLDLSVVEYASSHKVGQGLKIKFVQNMVDHLPFDPTAGEVSIFAWPSICLANLAGRAENGTGVALASLLAERLRGSASDPTIFEEVILSMRLLFARSKKSREMFLKRVGQEEQPVDPFWRECVLPINAGNAPTSSRSRFPYLFIRRSEPMKYFNDAHFANYALDPEPWNHLQDSGACNAAAVFPVFADRLRALQAFINSQPVGGFWELVRNSRNWAESIKFRVALLAIALTVIGIVIPPIVTKTTK